MFLELFDVGVQFFLEIEVVGYGLVGIGICGEGEEVDEAVVFTLLVAVELEGEGCVGFGVGGWGRGVEKAAQFGDFVLEYVMVGVLLADNIGVVLGGREVLDEQVILFRAIRLFFIFKGVLLGLFQFNGGGAVSEVVGEFILEGLLWEGLVFMGGVIFVVFVGGHEFAVLFVGLGISDCLFFDEAWAKASNGFIAKPVHLCVDI